MADRIEKEKKRKRREDGSSKPSKRVAVEGAKQIKIFLQEADKWAPVIASSPGLSIPSSIALKPFTKSRKSAPQTPSRSNDIANKELLLHSSEHPKLDYTAREEEAGASNSLLKHYIGVYDPATGKMEVMEARKLVVRGVVRAHEATAADEISADYRDRREDLGYTFGTKKAKKTLISRKENAVDQGQLSLLPEGKSLKLTADQLATLESMKDSVGNISTRAELEEEASGSKPRPKAIENESDPSKVYTAENVVGLDTLKLIPVRHWVEAMKAKKEVQTSSRFVSYRMLEQVGNTEKLKLLRYMALLVDLYKQSRPGKGGRMLPRREELKKILGDLPEALLEGVKRKFTVSGSMSKQMSDSLIMHLCALALMVDNCEVDMWDLKEDLMLETKQITQYFAEVGAKIRALPEEKRKKLNLDKAGAAQHKIAKLITPLVFPKVSGGRRAR